MAQPFTMWYHVFPCATMCSPVLPCVPLLYAYLPTYVHMSIMKLSEWRGYGSTICPVPPCIPLCCHVFPCPIVLPCIPLSYHVFPCAAMYSPVLSCIPLSYHVFPCGSPVLPCIPLSLYSPVLPCVPLCYHVFPCATMCSPVLPCIPLCCHIFFHYHPYTFSSNTIPSTMFISYNNCFTCTVLTYIQ
jgi:potassium voltage-gated channel Eag-related subfamily H protein 2